MTFHEFLLAMTAILLGGATVLLPIFALTVRFVFRPLIDSYIAARKSSGATLQQLTELERRIDYLEDKLRDVETENARLRDAVDFQLKLRG